MQSGAISNAVEALSSGGTTASIAVSLIANAQAAEQQQVATLFSSIGIGGGFSAFA